MGISVEKRIERMEAYLSRKVDGPMPRALVDYRWQGPCPGPSFRGFKAGEDLIEALPNENLKRPMAIAAAIAESMWRPGFESVDMPMIRFHSPHNNSTQEG